MDTPTLVLFGLVLAMISLMLAPRVLRMNKGRMLQNIALWVAIFMALAVAYRVIGPGREALFEPEVKESYAPRL